MRFLRALDRIRRSLAARDRWRSGKRDEPNLGDKGLSGPVVLDQAIDIYKKNTGTDPTTIDPESRHGKLLRAQPAPVVQCNVPQPLTPGQVESPA
jgi:hypothetical protein